MGAYALGKSGKEAQNHVPLEAVRVGPIGTDKVAHGAYTAATTTSEGCCLAVKEAVENLCAKIEPWQEQQLICF